MSDNDATASSSEVIELHDVGAASAVTDTVVANEDEVILHDEVGVAGNNTRGDEGVLEGVAIGQLEYLSSDSDDDVCNNESTGTNFIWAQNKATLFSR
jgi:hypothetical protein